MKRAVWCFLVLLVMACPYSVQAGPAQPLDVNLTIVSGQIKLTRVGQTMSDVISQGVPLYPGDLLETLRESKAELVYGDGTCMRIKPLTLLEVQPTALKVFKGKTWFKFVKRGSEFVIETPSLIAGIRGTEFDVSVGSRGKSVLSVMDGAVEVKGAKGAKKMVRKGYSSQCSPGDEASLPCRFPMDKKAAEWRTEEWTQVSDGDVNQLFINYMNLKNTYGDSDPRTQEVLQKMEKARKAERKQPKK